MADKVANSLDISLYREETYYSILKEMDKLTRPCAWNGPVPKDGKLDWCEQSFDFNGDLMVDLGDLEWLSKKTGQNFTIDQFVRALQNLPRFMGDQWEPKYLSEQIAKKAAKTEKNITEKFYKRLKEKKPASDLLTDVSYIHLFDLAIQLKEGLEVAFDVNALDRYAERYFLNEYYSSGVITSSADKLTSEVYKNIIKNSSSTKDFAKLVYLFAGAARMSKRRYDGFKGVRYRYCGALDRSKFQECEKKTPIIDGKKLAKQLERKIFTKIKEPMDRKEAARRIDLLSEAYLLINDKARARKVLKRFIARIGKMPSLRDRYKLAMRIGERMHKLKLIPEAQLAYSLAKKYEEKDRSDAKVMLKLLGAEVWIKGKSHNLSGGLKIIRDLKSIIVESPKLRNSVSSFLTVYFEAMSYLTAARLVIRKQLFEVPENIEELTNARIPGRWYLDTNLLMELVVNHAHESPAAILKRYNHIVVKRELVEALYMITLIAGAQRKINPQLKSIIEGVYKKAKKSFPQLAFIIKTWEVIFNLAVWKNDHPDAKIPKSIELQVEQLGKLGIVFSKKRVLTPADLFRVYHIYLEIGKKDEGVQFFTKCGLGKMIQPLTKDMLRPPYVNLSTSAMALGEKIINSGEVLTAHDLSPLEHLAKVNVWGSGSMKDLRKRLSGFIEKGLANKACKNLNPYPLADKKQWKDLKDELRITQLVKLYIALKSLSRAETIKEISDAIKRDKANQWSEEGGLMWWSNSSKRGKFEFIPAEKNVDDLAYVPPQRVKDNMDKAVLFVHLHPQSLSSFVPEKKLSDASYGPSSPDMKVLGDYGQDGLIINWSRTEKKFRAIFFTPTGIALDLGVYSFNTVNSS